MATVARFARARVSSSSGGYFDKLLQFPISRSSFFSKNQKEMERKRKKSNITFFFVLTQWDIRNYFVLFGLLLDLAEVLNIMVVIRVWLIAKYIVRSFMKTNIAIFGSIKAE